ncbi:MAG: hypothetical protein QX199_02665 [Methylococcaceae bacterium]
MRLTPNPAMAGLCQRSETKATWKIHRAEYGTKPPSLTHPNCGNALFAQHARQNNPKAAKPNAKAEATTGKSDRNESNPAKRRNKSPSLKEQSATKASRQRTLVKTNNAAADLTAARRPQDQT